MVKRTDPVVVAPDQDRPDEWIAGDIFFFRLKDTEIYVFTVLGDEAPLGLRCDVVKSIKKCDKEVAAYTKRITDKATPEEDKINNIWAAIQDFGKQ